MSKRMIALLLCLAMLCLAGCGGDQPDPTVPDGTVPDQTPPASSAAPVDVKAVYDECRTLMPEMIELDADMMLDYCGIRAEDCAQVYVAISADGLLTDELWIIEAVDEAALQRLLDLADNRLEAKAEESQTYSPEQYAVVQKAQVITEGNYVAVLVSPDVEALADVVNEGFGIQ